MPSALRSAHLFATLSDAQLSALAATSQTLGLGEGETLFHAGARATRFYLLRRGQMKLCRLNAHGSEKIVDIVHPDDTFGEALMFLHEPTYPVSAVALTPSLVTAFDNRLFRALLCDSVDTCLHVMGAMAQRLRRLLKEVDDLTLQSAATRVAGMLIRCMEKQACGAFELPAGKAVLATRLSMQPETISRIFGRLARDAIIRVHQNQVTILDYAALRKLADDQRTGGLDLPDPCTQGPQVDLPRVREILDGAE